MLTQFSPKLKYLELVWPWPSYYQNEISWSYYWYLPSHRIKKNDILKNVDARLQTNKLITYFLPSGRATSNFKYSPCPSGVVALSECSCFLSVFRLQRWGEFRGRPSYWHHHSPRHVEQSSLQVLQDQHDPQTAFHHRCPARYNCLMHVIRLQVVVSIFLIKFIVCSLQRFFFFYGFFMIIYTWNTMDPYFSTKNDASHF